MNIRKSCYFAIIVANSLLLAIGITLVAISIAKYGNKWPILTIFVHLLAILFPTACTCIDADDSYHSWDDANSPLTHISWVIFGVLVIIGYAVPVELFRARILDQTATILTVVGGTTILTAVLVYVRIIYVQKSDGDY